MRLITILLSLLLSTTAVAETLTNREVIALHEAGLSVEVIMEKITTSTVSFDTSTSALVILKNAGVPDTVISAMLQATPSAPPHAADHAAPPVEEPSPGPHFAAPQRRGVWSGTCQTDLWYSNDELSTYSGRCRRTARYHWQKIRAVCFTQWEENLGTPRNGRDRAYPFFKAQVDLFFTDGTMTVFGTDYPEVMKNMKKDFEAGYPELLDCDETYD